MKDRSLCSFVLSCITALTVAESASAANPRYAGPKPVYVKLEFDGDPTFPSLTVFSDTTGLARFTGSAFGLTPWQRNEVVERVRELLEEDYRPFNVKFVVAGTPPGELYTWGIDDTALVAPTGTCDEVGSSFFRIYGKAGGSSSAHDCNGNPIGHPRHARTWAGSFALPASSRAPSQPALVLGATLFQGTMVNVEHIAQALANSAAHEIGHLFLLSHPGSCTGRCRGERLMHSANEALEATNNKVFDDGERDTLRKLLGPRPALLPIVPRTVRDTGTGLVWTSDARIARRVQVADVDPDSTGALDYDSAEAYAAELDFLGYDDWHLPSALNPDLGDCRQPTRPISSSFFDFDDSLVQNDWHLSPPFYLGRADDCHNPADCQCSGSDLSHLTLDLIHFLEDPSKRFRDYDATRSYWSEASSPLHPRIFEFGFWREAPPETPAHVWPVRSTFALIDNGDGTISDTARGLMWKKTPLAIPVRAVEARRNVQDLVFAGFSDWRLPRRDSFDPDATCDDLRAPTTEGATSAGCSHNELGHLFHGWGVSGGIASAPFEIDAAAAPIWLEPDELFSHPLHTYSLANGTLQGATGATRALVFPVRFLTPNEVPRRANAVVEPHPNVVVRFRNVSARGSLTAMERSESTGPFFNRRVFELTTRATFDRTAGSVEVCLRYDQADFPLGVIPPEIDLRVAQEDALRRFVPLRLVSGYPDTTNNIVCGSTQSLGRFAVVTESP